MGLPGEPIAELTKFGWVIVSPGEETGVTNMFFSKTSLHDYEKLAAEIAWIFKKDVTKVIIFTRNLKTSWDLDLGDSMKLI